VAEAIADPNLSVERAKSLLQQLGSKVDELETRLTDFEDTSQQTAAEELPQTQTE
jgi:hypothetical protein